MVIRPYMNPLGRGLVKVSVCFARLKQTLTSKIGEDLLLYIYAVKMVIMRHVVFFFWPDASQILKTM